MSITAPPLGRRARFGRALRHHRIATKYTQDDVAAALRVSRTMVSYWENGERIPTQRQLNGMARLYGLHPDLFAV